MGDSSAGALRVLIVDDEPAVLDAYRHVLSPRATDDGTSGSEAGLNGTEARLELVLCRQGDEAVEAVRRATGEGHPFAVALVDMRLPPGPDGVWVAEQIRRLDTDVQIAIVTAYSDTDPHDIAARVPPPNRLLYLQKPLHAHEVRHFALALGAKWRAERLARDAQQDLEARVTARTDQLQVANEQLTRTIVLRHQAEEARRQSERRFREMADLLPDMIYETDADCRITYMNRTALEVLGYTQDDVEAGLRVADIAADDASGLHAEECLRALAGRDAPSIESYCLRRRDGSILHCEVHSVATRGADGGTLGFRGVVRDTTERQRLEARMRQAQKLESLGVLAGGVAHDFNNLLAGVLGNVQFAQADVPPDATVQRYLKRIETAALRAAELANQMLAYSGRSRLAVEAVDLSQVVAEMSHLLRSSIPRKIALERHLEPGLPLVEGDSAQLRQLIMNLITNAAEAVGEDEGAVTVSTGVTHAVRSVLDTAHPDDDLPEGQYVWLEVADTGCGMDEATKTRLFDPFFTTKFTGRGLGLAAALGIVRGHRGGICVDSTPGAGTTFRVLLPVPEEPRAGVLPAAAPDRAVEGWKGSGLVLIADDDPTVRAVSRKALEDAGFTVAVAEDGWQAVELFRRHSADLAAVLLDITMPRMNGDEALSEMQAIRDDVPIILSSGFSRHYLSQRHARHRPAAFIQKPYKPSALLAVVREAIEPSEAP
jgi:PAS domain S-box-containing protein